MWKSAIGWRMGHATSSLLNQQRALRVRPPNETKRRSKIKLVHLNNFINRRYTRKPLTRALVNRIYLRFEIFKSRNEAYSYMQLNDHMIRRIRAIAYKKLHNLLMLNESMVDELIEKYMNDPTDLVGSGVHFDEDGCPVYGPCFNSMFFETADLQIRRANFYRLLDAKLHNPTVFFDFRPINIGHINTNLIFCNLKTLVPLNLCSRQPFNFTFLNYQVLWDVALEPIMSIRPNFIDLHPNRSCTEFTHKHRKLIILMGRPEKPAKPLSGYDSQANYLIPLYTNRRSTNVAMQQYYRTEYGGKPNVELVYLPIEGIVKEEYAFNFSFYYYTLLALKDGNSVWQSILSGYSEMNDGIQAYNELEAAKRKSGDYRFSKEVKMYPFKYFDSLEDELL